MNTVDDFMRAALNAASTYPTVQNDIQVGDPRVLQNLAAQAQMLAMLSSQIDTAQSEPFLKARDSTILADATLKGILPLGRPCAVALTVANVGTSAVTLAAGRPLIDSKGRQFLTLADAVIPAGGSVSVYATQINIRQITLTADTSAPFFKVLVSQTDAEVFTTALDVQVNGIDFNYSPDWFNVSDGDFSYQATTDELRQLWVQFGSTGVVGYGIKAGDVVSINVTECEGQITDLLPGATLSLQYIYTADEGNIQITLASISDQGAGAPTMEELRVLSSYPSLYDHNAVYLGEFDMLLRRYLRPAVFISVWNEQIEESVRGASENNINSLFVSGIVSGMSDFAFQTRALNLLNRADDSYKYKFVAVNEVHVPLTISGTISVVHDVAAAQAQVLAALLSAYGRGASAVSKGRSTPIKVSAVSELLKANVAAFQDKESDFSVSITWPATMLPEMFCYLTADSITVTLNQSGYNNGLWSF